MPVFKSVALVAVTVLILATALRAQQTNVGNITGTVADTSGAVIPSAKVVAKNQGTGLTQEASANASGIYTVKLLPVGRYTVSVTQPGFKTAERTNIPVVAGETFSVDFQLAVGEVTQTVNVTGAPPTLDTTSATMGTTRTLQEIEELPINLAGVQARAAVTVAMTMSGVSYDPQDSGGQAFTAVARAMINGLLPDAMGYQIDGVEAGDGGFENGVDFISPTPDQIQEFRITANSDASQGFNAGVVIAMTTKSGTNNLHGSAYYYMRNDALEARQFFLSSVAEDKQNEPGFAIGGPVYIPKVYDGRNKTFFFATMDVYRFITQGSATTLGSLVGTVPTTLERQGNFAELLGPQLGTDVLGRPVYQGQIYDPATTRPDGRGGFIRDPFTFNGQLNVIDPARLSPISMKILEKYALPTVAGTQNNWIGPASKSRYDKDQIMIKVDQIISQKHRVSFGLERVVPWFLGSAKGTSAGLSGHDFAFGGNGWLAPEIGNSFIDDRDSYRYRFNYVWTARPDVLFNFRAGVTRNPKRFVSASPQSGPATTFARDAGLKGTLDPRIPQTSIQGLGGFGPIFDKLFIGTQRTPVSLDLNWTKGNHNIKFGADFEAFPYTGKPDFNSNGTFSFSDHETSLPEESRTGAGLASFLLGYVDSATVTFPVDFRAYQAAFGLFAQDSWRVTPKLTVNYGLRWDLFIPLHELQNKISTFDPSMPNPGAGNKLGALSIYGIGPGRNGLTKVYDYYFKSFGPKLGFAYAVNSRTVFRGSYGISYYPFWQKYYNGISPNTPTDGFSAARTAVSLDNGVTPAFNWNDGFPLTFPKLPIIDPTLNNGAGIGFVDRGNRPPMSQNIGFEVGREFPRQISLRVGYVGTLTHRIYGSYPLNVIPLSALQHGSLLTSNINSPEAQTSGIPLPYPGFNGSVAQALRPYPQYTAVTDLGAGIGNSTYHALQINVQRQFGSLTFLGNYTWSKLLTNLNPSGLGGIAGQNLVAQHPEIRKTAKSVIYNGGSLSNRPQILNLSWVYDLPFGYRRRYLGGAKGVLNQIVSNWRLSAIQHYQSGIPIRVTSRSTIPGIDSGIWPVLVQGQPIRATGCGRIDPGNPNQNRYLNPGAFRDPAPFGLGNVSVLPSLQQCAYLDEDIGIEKDVTITEHHRIRFGSIFNNAFNRHQFTGLNTDIDNIEAFGTFTGVTPGRTVQFFLRYEF